MKVYTKPTIEVVSLHVNENIAAPPGVTEEDLDLLGTGDMFHVTNYNLFQFVS